MRMNTMTTTWISHDSQQLVPIRTIPRQSCTKPHRTPEKSTTCCYGRVDCTAHPVGKILRREVERNSL